MTKAGLGASLLTVALVLVAGKSSLDCDSGNSVGTTQRDGVRSCTRSDSGGRIAVEVETTKSQPVKVELEVRSWLRDRSSPAPVADMCTTSSSVSLNLIAHETKKLLATGGCRPQPGFASTTIAELRKVSAGAFPALCIGEACDVKQVANESGAAQEFDEALGFNAQAVDYRGRVALEEGDYARAIDSFHFLILQSPKYVSAKFFLGRALIEDGQMEAGRNVLREFLAESPPTNAHRSAAAGLLR